MQRRCEADIYPAVRSTGTGVGAGRASPSPVENGGVPAGASGGCVPFGKHYHHLLSGLRCAVEVGGHDHAQVLGASCRGERSGVS